MVTNLCLDVRSRRKQLEQITGRIKLRSVDRCRTLVSLGVILIVAFAEFPCLAQTTAASGTNTIRRLPASSATWKAISTISARKPLSVLSLTTNVSQDVILAVTDRVNAHYNIDGYMDGYCGFGARLRRSYLGTGCVANVSFQWDYSVKRTVISLYGTNTVMATAWQRDMVKELGQTFGTDSVLRNFSQ